MVVEDSDVYSASDWTSFRTTFGLTSAYSDGSFTQVHPRPGGSETYISCNGWSCNCFDPGVYGGTEFEAILDAEWASAAAPSAAIELASCADSTTDFGGFIALQNILNNGGPVPAIVSISYGESEVALGASGNSYISGLYQQAVTAGVSVFVAAGDAGAAEIDRELDNKVAQYGISVNGMATTQYNVAVGGTDFGDTVTYTASTYWNSTNDSDYGSAKSYIPEIPWNGSCASELIADYEGYSQTYGSNGFCNSSADDDYFLNIVAGSGGPSGCATGAPPRTALSSAGPARDIPSLHGNPVCSATRATACGTFRTSRCSPPTAFGIITTWFAGPAPVMAELHVRAIPASGPAVAERRSPRRSWPAFKRSSISILAAAKVIRIPRTTHWPKPNMAQAATPHAIQRWATVSPARASFMM